MPCSILLVRIVVRIWIVQSILKGCRRQNKVQTEAPSSCQLQQRQHILGHWKRPAGEAKEKRDECFLESIKDMCAC